MAKKKIWKKVLITLFIIIIVLAAAVYCVLNFYIKPKYSKQIIEAVNLIMEDEEFASEINEALNDEDIQNEINNALSDGELQSRTDGSQQPADSQTGTNTNSGASAPQSKPSDNTASTPKPTKKPSSEGKSMMEVAKENVSPKDFAAGMKIAGKIDIGYLSGLTKGGLTSEEKQEAKSHIKSRLSGSEISQLKSLIAKYSYLLN